MIKSILSNWFALVVNGLVSIALTPVLIHGLGDFHYGMWILVGSLVEYSSFIDMGLRLTLQRFVARHQGAHQSKELSDTFETALALALCVCLMLCLLTGILAVIMPGFFGLKGAASDLFVKVVVLLGLSVAVTFPARVLASYLCGLQRYDVYNLAAVVTGLGRAALLVGVLHWGYGVLACSVVSLVIAALSLVLHWRLVRWVAPMASLQWWRASWERARELFTFSIYVFLANMGDFIRFRVDSFVIARWLAMSLVTPFNVATRIIDYFRSLMFTVLGPLMTKMSALDGQLRQKDLQEVFLRSTKITALLAFFIGSILMLDGKILLSVWVGPKYVSVYIPLMVLALGHSISVAQSPSVNILLARGRHRPMGWWTLIEGLFNLALSIYWAGKYGLVGVALGTAVPQIFVKLTLQPWFALRAAELSAREYILGALARPLAVCGIFLLLGRLGVSLLPGVGLLGLVSNIAWQTLLFGILAYYVGFTASEREFLWERGKQFVSNFRLARAS
jgi:O-antigen/teichoic acid export membrane protein